MASVELLQAPVQGDRLSAAPARIWPRAAGLVLFLGAVVLLSRNLPAAARIIAVFTDCYDLESSAFFLLSALLIGSGMLPGVLTGALSARLFSEKRP